MSPEDPAGCIPAPAPVNARPVVQPLAPGRYKLQLTIAMETHDTLRQLQDLMRHAIPDGDPARIIDRALTLLLEDVLRQKCAVTKSPRVGAVEHSDSRSIPAAVRRAVWTRDGGRCAFVGTHGRCGETAFLEYHHLQPYAAGGKATVENIELRCRAHNAYEAHLFFSGEVTREFDVDSFWNELPPLEGNDLARLRDDTNWRTPERLGALRIVWRSSRVSVRRDSRRCRRSTPASDRGVAAGHPRNLDPRR